MDFEARSASDYLEGDPECESVLELFPNESDESDSCMEELEEVEEHVEEHADNADNADSIPLFNGGNITVQQSLLLILQYVLR